MYAKETRVFPGRGEILEGKGGVIGARRCRGRVRVGVEMAQPDSTPDE